MTSYYGTAHRMMALKGLDTSEMVCNKFSIDLGKAQVSYIAKGVGLENVHDRDGNPLCF